MNRHRPSVNGKITKTSASKEGVQFPDTKVELKIGRTLKKKKKCVPSYAAAACEKCLCAPQL